MTFLPPDLKKTIIMIGEGAPGVRPKGSSFLIKYKNKDYAITAKHVIQNIPNPIFVFNNKSGDKIRRTTHNLNETFGYEWAHHSDKDVDLSITPFPVTQEDDLLAINVFQSFNDINDGDEVFFMGFPFGLSQSERITPLIRQGCVSLKFEIQKIWHRVRYAPKTFLIDGHVSAGNSGSPVFRKPTSGDNIARLYGVITSHITSDVLDIRGRSIGKGNSGLGIASSIDHVIDLIESL